MKSGSRSAFTLIELVISAALMSMILTGAYLCLQAGVSSQKMVDARQEVFQNARVALALMSADLRAACPLSKDFDFLGMHRMLGDVEADNLDFATHNYIPRHVREFDWCEISYFVDKDPQTGQLNLWRRRDPTPDDDPLSGGTREEIAQGLLGLKLEYYDGLDWYEEWGDTSGKGKADNSWRDHPNLTGMPEAVRITLLLDPDRRPKKAVLQNSGTNEPPLVFQTVARLNLAAAALRSQSSGASTNVGSAAPAQAQPPGTTGGPQ